MNFSLPENFANDTNQLVTLLIDYDASVKDVERQALMRKALVVSCRLLTSIDLSALSSRINEIYAEVKRYERMSIRKMTWSEAMFGSASHFEYFLRNIEDGILRCTGIEEKNRDRILKELALLRQLAHSDGKKLNAYLIVSLIRNLQEEVCQLKDQVIAKGLDQATRIKVLKTILVMVIISNAAGSVAFPAASPAAIAASVTLGGVAQYMPDVL